MAAYGYALKVNDIIRFPVTATKEGATEAHGGIARWLADEDGGVMRARLVRVRVEEVPD